jgi:hypothetical protein
MWVDSQQSTVWSKRMKSREDLMIKLAHEITDSFQAYLSETKDDEKVMTAAFLSIQSGKKNNKLVAGQAFQDALKDGIKVLKIVTSQISEKMAIFKKDIANGESDGWQFDSSDDEGA